MLEIAKESRTVLTTRLLQSRYSRFRHPSPLCGAIAFLLDVILLLHDSRQPAVQPDGPNVLSLQPAYGRLRVREFGK